VRTERITMTDEKILEVISKYQDQLAKMGIEPWEYPHIEPIRDEADVFEHCAAMLPKMRQFLLEGRREKVFRWLGFIQGCFWSLGIVDMESLKNDNRSDEGEG